MKFFVSILTFFLASSASGFVIDKSSVALGDIQLGAPFSERRLVSFVVENTSGSIAESLNVSLVQSTDSDQDKMFKILRNTCLNSLPNGEKCSLLIKAQPIIEGDYENPSYITPAGNISASFSIASSLGVIPFSISAEVNNIVALGKSYPIDIVRDENEDQRYRVSLKDESQGAVEIVCPAKDGDFTAEAYCGSIDSIFNKKDCEMSNVFTQLGGKECGVVVQFSPKENNKLYELKLTHKFGSLKATSCAELKAYSIANRGSGYYNILINGQDKRVYCDFDFDENAWMLVDKDTVDFVTRDRGCYAGFGEIDNNGFWQLNSRNGGGKTSTHGGCGIGTKERLKFSKIRLSDGYFHPYSNCSGMIAPNITLQVISDENGPVNDYYGLDLHYPGASYVSASSSANFIFSKTQENGLSTTETVEFEEGEYFIHMGVASYSSCANRVANSKVWVQTKVDKIGKSCKDILDRNPSVQGEDGDYIIDPDGWKKGNEPFAVYCDMTTEGGGWTRIIKDHTTTVEDLSKFGSTSQIESTFYSHSTYGVGWGTNDDAYKALSIYMPFNDAKIKLSGFYNSPSGGLGHMNIISNGGYHIAGLHDSWADNGTGQSLTIGNTAIFTANTTNVVNQSYSTYGANEDKGLYIEMKGYNSSYGYTKRYIGEFWIR